MITARKYSYDSILEYLDKLPEFDDSINLIEILRDMFKLEEPNSVIESYFKAFILGMVWRAKEPGCKFDLVLVLVSDKEGTGKTSFFEYMGHQDKDWYTSDIGRIDNKDAKDAIRGKWLVDMSEITRHSKKHSEETIKAFLTDRKDTFRPAYGRMTQNFHRRCVFCGTSNNYDFLDGSGDHRRNMVLTVASSGPFSENEPLKEIINDNGNFRDLCFAWGLKMYEAGELPVLSTKVEKMQYELNKENKIQHPLFEDIRRWLEIEIPQEWEYRVITIR